RDVMFPLPAELRGSSGPGTLMVRPEDVEIGTEGTSLPLSARLFLGQAAEYRFPVGDTLLRAVGPPIEARAGQVLQVRFRKAKLFPVTGAG
ncbi:MAG TPA: ABC transporter ATP-binding protein, partial [Hyalangium sp.]|nr:ABC transporter ATP-binding protein [Hyalangium sp.]